MKSCETRQADLKAYLDGELPLLERAAMWLHLLQCAKCREAKTAMTEMSRRVGQIDGDALPAALRARILSSVTYTDNRPADPTPGPVRNHRVRPPLLLVGGATAAALFAAILMRPLLFPASLSHRDAAPVADSKPSSSRAAAPAMPSASKEMQQQPVFSSGRAPAAFGGSGAASPSPVESEKAKTYNAGPAISPAIIPVPKSAANGVAKPMRQRAGDVEQPAADSVNVDGRRAIAKPQNAPLPEGGGRLENYMNSLPIDRADAIQHADGAMAASAARSELKKEADSESHKRKARAKTQALRSARGQHDQASHSVPSATSK